MNTEFGDERDFSQRRQRRRGHRARRVGAGRRRGSGNANTASAEVVRDASEAVDHAVADLRLEVEDFLGKVAV
ncbi:MAG: hypothetical protein WB803_24540 [Pseudolabrys sp.]